MNVRELAAERRDHFEAADKLIKAARASGKDMTSADLELFHTHTERIKAIDGLIAKSEMFPSDVRNPGSMFSTNGQLGAFAMPPGQREQSVSMTLREAYQHGTAEQREQILALATYIKTGSLQAAADLRPSGDGGYLIPSLVQSVMERNYAAFAPVVSVARLFGTDNGDPVTYPVLSDTEAAEAVAPAALTGADATVSGDTPPTDLTGPQLKAWKVSSKPVFINREIISDGVVDIVQEVIGALLARIVRWENLQYTSGDGTTEPEGFMTNCSTHAVGDVAIDLDLALDLAYACPALYRPQGVYMMSDTTCKYLRKLKTGIASDKRQLWADADATKGTPATLHGYPIVINNDMESVGADGKFTGKSPLAFGNFSKFVVRQAERNQPYMYRYNVPARDGQAVILFRRSDSKLLVPTAIYRLIN